MSFAFDGQLCKWRGVLVRVVVAAGDTARIVNELHKIDRWVDVKVLEAVS